VTHRLTFLRGVFLGTLLGAGCYQVIQRVERWVPVEQPHIPVRMSLAQRCESGAPRGGWIQGNRTTNPVVRCEWSYLDGSSYTIDLGTRYGERPKKVDYPTYSQLVRSLP
jgi:hypothetical protein